MSQSLLWNHTLVLELVSGELSWFAFSVYYHNRRCGTVRRKDARFERCCFREVLSGASSCAEALGGSVFG